MRQRRKWITLFILLAVGVVLVSVWTTLLGVKDNEEAPTQQVRGEQTAGRQPEISCSREKPCTINVPVVSKANSATVFSKAIQIPMGGKKWCIHWVVPPKFEPFLKVRLDGDEIHSGTETRMLANLSVELNIVAPISATNSLPVGKLIKGRYSLWSKEGSKPCFE